MLRYVETKPRGAYKLIPQLLEVPGRKFLSMEPLLGPVEFSNVTGRSDYLSQLGKRALNEIDWVICGGESGQKARPMHPDWARSIRDQCAAANVPFHFKQWGDWWPGEFGRNYQGQLQDFTDGQQMIRAGKKAAGHLLDEKEHQEVPVN